MTITLHEHPFAAYCWKALVALYERDVPFTRAFVGDAADRERLAALWPMASIPVLVDDDAGVTLPESSVVVEYLDRFGDAPPLVPADPEGALRARLWDRLVESYVMTPMQKIVGDALRPEGRADPQGVEDARATLDRAYALLDDRLPDGAWIAGPDFGLADCCAAPALHYAWVVHRWDRPERPRLSAYADRLMARPSVARVVEEAREHRVLFPLPWPADVA